MRRTLRLRHGMPTRSFSHVIQALGTLLLWFTCLPMAGQAQAAAPITPSGPNTQVNLSQTPPVGQVQYDITGGTRPGGANGTNLFHSFGDFNVPTSNIANFLNAGSVDLAGNPLAAGLPTSNILGVVTGVNPSIIFGTIQTNGTGGFGNANLFLMNPYGFLFGPNATVNVGGMVAFTTADYLRFTNGVLFNATPNAAVDPLLHAAPVDAFGFLGSNPTAIAVQGSTLKVQPGQSISLVGGNQGFTYTNPDTGSMASVPVPNGVTVTGGHLLAPGGQVNIASVASPGEILARTLAQAPNINGQSFGALGTIQISQQSVTDVRGNGGGTVLIRGGQFVLDNSTISANITGPGPVTNGVESIGGGIDIVVSQDSLIQTGSILETSVLGNATPGVQYGGVHIKADRIEILGDPAFDFDNGPFTGIHSDVASRSTGANSGPIKLEADSILVQDFVTLGTLTDGIGNGGDIILRTNGNLELNGPSLETDSISGPGNAGNIDLTSTHGNILMTNGPSITSQAFGSGTVGHIAVTAPAGEILLSNIDIFSGAIFTHDQGTGGIPGKGGIQITAKDLTIVNSGIQLDNFSPVQPGDLTVNLTGTLNLSGTDIQSSLVTITRSEARSANLNITAHDILLIGNSLVSTETYRNGDGGTLNIFAQNLELTNGAQIRSSSIFNPFPPPGPPETPSGAGGTITIQGLTGQAQSVQVDGAGSGIFTNTKGTGPGGSITISADSVMLQNGGTLSAATEGTAPTATGGSITVKATDHVTMTNGASITASSTGPGDAGNVTISSDRLTVASGGRIEASTSGAGKGGSIAIMTTGDVTVTGLSTNGQVRSGIFAKTQSASNSGSGGGGDAAKPGDAGNIAITAKNLLLDGGAQIDSSTTSSGAGGSVSITTAENIMIAGSSTRLTSDATRGDGKGGNITLVAKNITVRDNASVTAATGGKGDADNVTLTALDQLLLQSAGTVTTSTSGSGKGGTVNVQASRMTLENGATVSAVSSGTGDAGNISINAGQQLDLMGKSSVKTGAERASGGDINIRAIDRVRLVNSSIITSVFGGAGDGGDITIDPNVVVLQGSQVKAEAFKGVGGDITITTPLFLRDSTSQVSALSPFGLNGTVTIQSPTSNLSESLGTLPSEPNQAHSLLTQRCAALANGQASSFVIAGREHLPTDPGGWLSSPLAFTALGESLDTDNAVASAPAIMPMVSHDTGTVSLRRLTPIGFLMANFADGEATGCRS